MMFTPQKKRFKTLYIPEDWPNSVVVCTKLNLQNALRANYVQRDAYYHPTVDNSEEPFKWGLPDLDGLRE